ncbi:MAG: orotate phosphoribosyltransferase [Planctomycetota bacterium]
MNATPTAADRLAELLRASIRTGEVKLASGRTTDFYIDGRLVTLSPRGLKLVAELAFHRLRGRCTAVGGPTSGADPIVAAIGLEALAHGVELKTFFTRGQAKQHGMQRRLEGPPLSAADRVVLVDDVATSGGSLIKAAEAVREETGATVAEALVIVDREEGAGEALAAAGLQLLALFARHELVRSSV